jgi:SpoVK/Ycf46/Vps4 family AAA+-type ATPase
MQQRQTQAYRDQFEYLEDCFLLIRKRADAFNLRSEAQETESMVRFSDRLGLGMGSERNHFLEIYHGVEAEITALDAQVRRRKEASEELDTRFPLDTFAETYGLEPDEVRILLVLLHNESQPQNHHQFKTGTEILNLLFSNPVDSLRACRFLGGGATLMARGLIRSVSEDTSNFLRAAYEVTETTLYEVLGARERSTMPVSRQPSFQTAYESLESSYRVVAPHVSLDQVVLSPALRRGIEEILWQAREGKQLYREWGLDRVLEKGKGTIVLMSGPPGTGKTMTAEAMAHALGKHLFIVDYSQLESKWIGETEKNIVGVFRAAAEADVVLLLDEADAILGYRLDGGQYNERAYNRQVSILLTELEAYEGVCILTTNRSFSLDDGLARRISASFSFTVPGPSERLRIWKLLLPTEVPVGDDIDLEELAHRFPLAGGHIKNAIMSAVRKAARRDGERVRVRQADFGEAAAAERGSFRPGARAIGFGDGPILHRSA